MKQTDQNGFGSTEVLDEVPQQPASSSAPPSVNANVPFVPSKDKPKSILKENGRLVFIGAGIVVVLLLLAFNGISRHSLPAQKNSATAKQQPAKPDNSVATSSVTPILDAGRSPSQEPDGSLVNPDQIGRMSANSMSKPSPPQSVEIKHVPGSSRNRSSTLSLRS